MTLFCLIIVAFFLPLALVRLRHAFLLFVVSMPLLPAYVAVPIVQGGAGLSLSRLLSYALILGIGTSILRAPRAWREVWRRIGQWQMLWLAALLLFGAKLASTLMNGPPVGVFYWFDETVGLLGLFLLSARFVTDLAGLRRLMWALIASLMIVLSAVFIEVLMAQPLLYQVVEIGVSTVGADVLDGFERGGTYRAMGLFDNPLSLAEYLCLSVAFLSGAHRLFFKRRHVAYWALMGLLIWSAWHTGARFAPIVLVLAGLAAMIVYHGNRFPAALKPILWALTLAGGAGLSFAAYMAIANVHWLIETFPFLLGDTSSGIASVIARAYQYETIPAEILGNATSGLLGEGFRSDIVERLGARLDNYYLRTLIEGGLIGLGAFLVLAVIICKRSLAKVSFRHLEPGQARALRFFLILFFAIFMAAKFFLSMSFNNPYFFIFAGAVAGLASPAARRSQIRTSDAYLAGA